MPETLRIVQQRLITRANLLDMSRRFGIHDHLSRTFRRPDRSMTCASAARSISGRRKAPLVLRHGVLCRAHGAALGRGDERHRDPDPAGKRRAAHGGVRPDAGLLRPGSGPAERGSGPQSEKILQFKLQNKDALPDSLDYRRARQGSQQERLLQIDRELSSLEDRRANSSISTNGPGRSATSNGGTAHPRGAASCRSFRHSSTTALIVYAPQNPRVRVLRGADTRA